MSKFNTIFLGKNAEYSTDPAETGLNNNIVVIGGSGSGKTMSVMEMKLLRNEGRSMIVNVSKKNLIRKYTPYFQAKGYEVRYLDMANPKFGNVSFDPLRYIGGMSDTVGIQNLAEGIVCAKQPLTQQRDPYWPNAAMHLLMSEIYCVLAENRRATLADVLNYHDDLEITENTSDNGFTTNHDEDYKLLKPTNPGAKFWKSFRNNAYNTAMCVYSSLNTPLQTMFPMEIRASMRNNMQVDLRRLATHPTILFIYTSPVNQELHSLANLFMSFAIKDLYEYAESRRSGVLPVPVDLVFDDFACGSRVQKFPELISIFREKNISTTIMLQSEAQLSAMYSWGDAQIILDNCDTYLYLGGMNAENAMRVAKRCNLPNEKVLDLPVGKEILIRRGQRPAIKDRYDILNDLEYQKVTREYHQWIAGKERSA